MICALLAKRWKEKLYGPRNAQRVCGRANPDLMSKRRSELDVEPVRGGKNSRRGSKKGRREEELRSSPEKRRTRLHSEKQSCPRRENLTAVETVLRRCQTDRGGKAECPAEQSDRHPVCGWEPRVTSEPLLKVETIMRALSTG